MKVVRLVRVGTVDLSLVENLQCNSPKPEGCWRDSFIPSRPRRCLSPEPEQFHSAQILERIETLVRPGDWRLPATTDVYVFIPILKYVLGEAQLGGTLRGGVDVPLAAGILWRGA